MQAKKRSRETAVLASADARAAESEGAPAVVLTREAVTLEAGSPPAEQLQLLNKGTATAAFSLAPVTVGLCSTSSLMSASAVNNRSAPAAAQQGRHNSCFLP